MEIPSSSISASSPLRPQPALSTVHSPSPSNSCLVPPIPPSPVVRTRRFPDTPFLDHPLLPNPCNLHEFNQCAEAHHKSERYTELSQLVLSTRGDSGPSLVHQHLRDFPFCFVKRFFGQIVSISDSLFIERPLTLTNKPSWANAIPDRVRVPWSSASGPGHCTELISKIPNMLLGTFGSSSSVYLLVPSLYNPDSPCLHIPVAHLRELWDRVVIPSLVDVGLSASDVVVPASRIPLFTRCVMNNAASHVPSLAENLRFVLWVDAAPTYHQFSDEAVTTGFRRHLEDNHLSILSIHDDAFERGMWFFDVGLEVTHQDKSVVWSASHHEGMIRALLGCDDFQLDVTSPRYEKFFFAHMSEPACAHVLLDGDDYDGPVFVRLSVDEHPPSFVDELDERVAKVTVLDFIKRPQLELSFPARLSDIYLHDVDTKAHVKAIATVTAPLRRLLRVVPSSAAMTVFDSCLVMDTRDLALLRFFRAEAIRIVFALQCLNVDALRTRPREGLGLTATLAWLVNTLCTADARDVEGRDGRLPLPLSLDNGFLSIPSLRLPEPRATNAGVPYLVGGHLDDEHFVSLLGDQPHAVLAAFAESNAPLPKSLLPRPAPHGPRPSRFTNISLGSPSRGIYRRSFITDPDTTPLDVGPVFSADPGISDACKDIIALFVQDILAIAPTNIVEKRSLIGSDPSGLVFTTVNLANISTAVRWKHASLGEWTRAFSRFFPTATAIRAGIHPHYTGRAYFQRWTHLLATLDGYSFRVLRSAIWATFFQRLYWVPNCLSDCIWSTEPNRLFRSSPLAVPGVQSVNILVNGAEDPIFDPDTAIF